MRWSSNGRLLASLVLLGFALALYANSLKGDFVFDDHAAIQVNPDVRSNTPLGAVFRNDFWGLPLSDQESHKSYRPLTVLSFRLNHYLHGLWSPGFHMVNIAAHSAVCVLFFWVCLGFQVHLVPSFTAALLFAAHPIHTEAVSNIVGRSELLAAICFLLALITYQRACRTGDKYFMQSLAWVFLTLALSSISLLCKENGVTVLGLCLMCDFAKAVKLKSSILHKTMHRYNYAGIYTVMMRVSLLLGATITLLFVRIYLIGQGTPTFIDSDNPASFSPHFKTRLLTYTYLCAVNVWLLLCPSHLCYDWSMGSIPLVESLADLRNLAPLSLLVALTVLLANIAFSYNREMELVESKDMYHYGPVNRNCNNNASNLHMARITTYSQKKPKLLQFRYIRFLPLLALSWMVIPFLPASNIFFPVGFVVAERVLYLPSMGFSLLVALGINSFWNKRRRESMVAILLLLLVFSTKTVLRSAEWRSASSIAQSALSVNPGNAKVFMSVGNELTQQGDRRCELFYREAIRLRPQYASAWANLGLVLINTGRPLEAEEAYLTALSHKPDHINSNTNMGHLCRMQGRWAESRQYFMEALKRRPMLPTLHYYVGMASQELGTERDMEIAEREYSLAVQYNPQYQEAHLHLGQLLATHTPSETRMKEREKKERMNKALFHYRAAVALRADDLEAQSELRSLLVDLNRTSKAEKLQEVTASYSPHHSQPPN